MAKAYQAQTRCECQATLRARLTTTYLVLEGEARRDGAIEKAPAHSIGVTGEVTPETRFDIGWLCPFCNRNVLRTFYAKALRTVVIPDPPAPPIAEDETKGAA